MTADPRDTARQWLAEVIGGMSFTFYINPITGEMVAPGKDIADAILSAPGVEVREEVPGFDVEPGHRVPMYRVVTIRLPVQPIEAP